MTLKPKTLADLPHFTITSISYVGSSARLAGVFDHLHGVAEGRGWLFARNAESMIGDLKELTKEQKTAVFIAAYPNRWAAVGVRVPYVDGYWDASDIEMVLDENHGWRRLTFDAQDALMSRYEGGRMLRKASDVSADENTPGQIIPGGWDHEHCKLCWKHIDPQQIAYVDTDRNWLCEACYEDYIVRHDLSFIEICGRKWPATEASQ
ncbi:MAG TPA: hypothetical protein VGR72_00330 [Candidatus Acidoferrales bacterium]|nr:hypothetical protein [Candidatus Acidoferrales bacterium]